MISNRRTATFLFELPGQILSYAIILPILFIVVALVSCSPDAGSPDDVEVGFSREEVIEVMGQPAATQEFILPDQPFFGPQEGLANLLPAGVVVEEWVYELDGEILYVWFAGEPAELREGWKVVATGVYPEGAVF